MSDSARTMPGTTYRNGMPPSGGYVYRGTGTEAAPGEVTRQVRQRVTARRIADGRCTGCGYLPGSPGHEATCGGES